MTSTVDPGAADREPRPPLAGTTTSATVAHGVTAALDLPADLAGVPAASVPCGLDANGLPLGLQVITRSFDEETMFAVSAALERAADFSALPTLRAGG